MKILSVDDDALNQEVVKSMLAVAGVEMVEAANAQACFAMADHSMVR